MRSLSLCVLLACLAPVALYAQVYCSPTFANGCSNWRTISIDVGAINYVEGSDCTISDYTALSTTVVAGDVVPMEVVNGAWCGVSVWVDFDQNFAFDTTENLYYIYIGGATDYTYNFNITIPASTPVGVYRMRVISPWGSDGYSSTNMNGFGPCGSYDYGNFIDLTLNVALNTGLAEAEDASAITAYPNPTSGQMHIDLDASEQNLAVNIYNPIGELIHTEQLNGASFFEHQLPEAKGLYLIQFVTEKGEVRTARVAKE